MQHRRGASGYSRLFLSRTQAEYQRELILQEITTLEKAYRLTTNMELYSSHARRTPTSWFSTPDTVCFLPPVPAINPLNPQPPPNTPTDTIPPLPHPPLRLLLPPPVLPTVTHASPTPGGYGNRTRYSATPQPNRTVAATNLLPERTTKGRNQGEFDQDLHPRSHRLRARKWLASSARDGAISHPSSRFNGKPLVLREPFSSRYTMMNTRGLPMSLNLRRRSTKPILISRLVLRDPPGLWDASSKKLVR